MVSSDDVGDSLEQVPRAAIVDDGLDEMLQVFPHAHAHRDELSRHAERLAVAPAPVGLQMDHSSLREKVSVLGCLKTSDMACGY